MSGPLGALWEMGLTGSLAACAVLGLRPLLNRVSPRYACRLWLVAFFLLACPLRIESPLGLLPRGGELLPAALPAGPVMGAVPAPLPAPAPGAAPVPAEGGGVELLALAWLLGAAALVVWEAVRCQRLRRRVYDATRVGANVFESDRISTAFVLGVLRPKIYLPTAVRGRALMLRHERAHLRRRDHLVKPLLFCVLALHWWNPLVWVSYGLAARDMELACDEAALRGRGPKTRRAYALLLVQLYARTPALRAPLAFGEGSPRAMKGRITHVLHGKTPPRWAGILCSLLIVLFAAGFTAPPSRDSAPARPAAPVRQTAGTPADEKPARGYVSRRDSLVRSFAPLAPFGVVYDADRDAAFYQGGRVRLLVILHDSPADGEPGWYFDLCYRDGQGLGDLCLEGVKDDTGALTEVRPLDPETAAALLPDLDTGSAPGWVPEELAEAGLEMELEAGDLPAGSTRYVVMDGTQIIDRLGLAAHDLTREAADATVQSWMARCDNAAGAYALRVPGTDSDTLYLYYNGGGRYPWLMSAEGGRITVELVADSGLETNDGYTLLSLTAPKAYTDLRLTLGGWAWDLSPA